MFDTYYNHSKLVLVDERYLMVGSMNFSANSMDNNRELSLLVDNPRSVLQ